ncbi:MAG: flagellum-specific synthase [Clostridiales bacterium]|nr:flagellum-specific synthase [Clostridiales bacterium]MDK2991946.1 flagellum-specific synthase [Clostridiales bacterium]
MISLGKYKEAIKDIDSIEYKGAVSRLTGLTIEADGPGVEIGRLCRILSQEGSISTIAEVVGFREERILLMPLGNVKGIGPGSTVVAMNTSLTVPVGPGLLGRVLDGLGRPLDSKGPLAIDTYYDVENDPPDPLARRRICDPIILGIKAIDGLLTCGYGQRMGVFAGSGVGKSTLMGMMARYASADVNVIALVGERGREVKEFIEKDLGDGLNRSVLVVATSDQPPLIRTKAAFVATAIAEYFRDQGCNVLLMMDSLTRFAMAQREVGLAIGEPPVSRGYTPSVFATMPRLLERAGTSDKGSITGIYTVLVDGDDFNEPVTDNARSILDGHIVLSRELANRNHYPPIDVLASVSRVMPDVVTDRHMMLASQIKKIMAVYKGAEDLINIGAYVKGSSQDIDYAIEHINDINAFLQQPVGQAFSLPEILSMMENIIEK